MQQLRQRFARGNLVEARLLNFTANAHKLCAFSNRHRQICNAEDGDHIARQQGQVVGRVFVFNGFAQIEGDQHSFDFLSIKALDGGIVPVDFFQQVFNFVEGVLILSST